MERLIAIGDIHGNAAALETLLRQIEPRPTDTFVTLGDYIDRGPDTRRVVEILCNLGSHCRLIPIMGNHEEVLLSLIDRRPMRITFTDWLSLGGEETLRSYGVRSVAEIPPDHITFFRHTISYRADAGFFFTHALYDPSLPPSRHGKHLLRWARFEDRKTIPPPHMSGRRVIVGHTAQRDGRFIATPHFVCLDTCSYSPDGFLTAMELHTDRVWQATHDGHPYTQPEQK